MAGTLALFGLTLVVAGAAIAGCSTREDRSMTTDERLAAAREAAVASLRAITSLHDGWPPEVPEPAVNDCRIDGQRAIQLTYLAVMRNPDDPKGLVDAATEYWRSQGLTVDTSHRYVNDDAGTDYIANARVHGIPHPSIEVTNLGALLYVDSVCVLGDPDDYR